MSDDDDKPRLGDRDGVDSERRRDGETPLFAVPGDDDATIIHWPAGERPPKKGEAPPAKAATPSAGSPEQTKIEPPTKAIPTLKQSASKAPLPDELTHIARPKPLRTPHKKGAQATSGQVKKSSIKPTAKPTAKSTAKSTAKPVGSPKKVNVAPPSEAIPTLKEDESKAHAVDDDRTRIVRPKPPKKPSEANLQASSALGSPRQQNSVQAEIKPKAVSNKGEKPPATSVLPALGENKNHGVKDDNTSLLPDDDRTHLVGHTLREGLKGGGAPRTPGNKVKVINNRFELVEVLGSGGMGKVYKAIDRRKVEANERDPYVAVKVLNDDFKDHPLAFISLQRESRKTQALAHPNIVNVHDFDRDGDLVFMTMEYLEGEGLDAMLAAHRDTGLDPSVAASILKDMCAALIYAHSHNVTHSDFKPGNVFVSTKSANKVFDFGIARAVSQVEESSQESLESAEHTKFDAANLGALTPAYASLEMLEGQTPDVRDDIYALGCVAYELYTGSHPFAKKPANKAAEKGLKPARIAGMKRRQWRAIERALAFRREDRIASVTEFWAAFESRSATPWWVSGVAVIGVLGVALLVLMKSPEFDELEFRKGIRSDVALEVEAEVKRNVARTSLDNLLAEATFDALWEGQVEGLYREYRPFASPSDAWLGAFISKVSRLYLTHAEQRLQEGHLADAERSLAKADAWFAEAKDLIQVQPGIMLGFEQSRDALLLGFEQYQQQLDAEQKNLERIEAEKLARQKAKKLAEQRRLAKKRGVERYNAALAGLKESVSCKGGIDFAEIKNKLTEYKALAGNRYAKEFTNAGNDMAECLKKVAAKKPATAEKMQAVALKLFPNNNAINGLHVDYCVTLKPGSGRISNKNVCRDKIQSGGLGPELVVAPAQDGGKLAVGKYEVSVAEMNHFCYVTKKCALNETRAGELPAAEISFKQAKEYVAWLKQETHFDYRIPTLAEWQYVARAQGRPEDPNRNCSLNVRGIVRGRELVSANSGKPNGWGLVNHVGNVQEWTTQRGTVYAAGANRTDPMNECRVEVKRPHNGNADAVTGFRVIRMM